MAAKECKAFSKREFHTCVVDGPLYRSTIAFDAVGDAAAEVLHGGANGQPDDVQWWVLRDDLEFRLIEKIVTAT